MTVRVPDGSFSGGSNITVIDFRETSPGKSEKEMYGANRAGRVAAEVGGLAIGVPGELRGLEMGTFSQVIPLMISAQDVWDCPMAGPSHAGRRASKRMADQPRARSANTSVLFCRCTADARFLARSCWIIRRGPRYTRSEDPSWSKANMSSALLTVVRLSEWLMRELMRSIPATSLKVWSTQYDLSAGF